MKKIMSLLIALLLPVMLFTANADAAKYIEGKHYIKVSETASSKPEVREYFSFYCPHCRSFEPFAAVIEKGLPDNVSFVRNHVDFLRAASPEIQFMLTKAVVVAQLMEMEHKLSGALFNYIQVQKAMISSEKDIRNVFVLNGADGAKFDKLMKSFSVNSRAKSLKRSQDSMSAKRALTGVPAVFVNGQYRINPQELDRANFEKDYNNLVHYLLTLK